MKNCPFCGYSNYDTATVCRKCDGAFGATQQTVYRGRTYWIGPERARHWRNRALTMVAIGLLIKVYWGGYGPWPPVDSPSLVTARTFLEPVLLIGGGVLYVLGWIAAYA